MRQHLLCLYLAAGILGTSFAATFHVAMTGDDQNDGLEWGSAKLSIQTAIDDAADGDHILVSNGTYTAVGSYVINITKSLTIESVNGPDVTIIDGENERRCVYANVTTSGDPMALSGFTLTRGSASSGAGIYKTNDRDLYVTNCLISANESIGDGGGVCKASEKSRMFMYDCVISNNTATSRGGGINSSDGCLCISRCEIVDNYAVTSGGGVYGSSTDQGLIYEITDSRIALNTSAAGGGATFYGKSNSMGVFVNCLIESNTATTGGGGGIYHRGGSDYSGELFVSNCIIRGNETGYDSTYAGGGARIYGAGRMAGCLIINNEITGSKGGGGGLVLATGEFDFALENTTIAGNRATHNGGGLSVYTDVVNCVMRNVIIYGNQSSVVGRANTFFASGTSLLLRCCLEGSGNDGVPAGADVVYADPLFADSENGDYRLLSGSPCINAGSYMPWMEQALDLDGHRRVDRFSGVVDIGCYEYVPQGVMFKLR